MPWRGNLATRLMVSATVARMRLWLDRALLCIDQLEESHIWYRPNPCSNAVGNLILHLVGNLRQWILGGIGGAADDRDRPAEFSATSGQTKSELRTLLIATVEQCCELMENVSVNQVLERKVIQGEEVTIASALVGVLSHFSLHLGQMQYIAKMLLGDSYNESWKPKDAASC